MLNEIFKPMSRYTPQDLRWAFGSLDIILPDLATIPVRWYGD